MADEDDQLDYNAIRRRVQQRVNKRKELIIHAGVFLIVNVIMWITWLLLHLFPAPADSQWANIYEMLTGFMIPILVTAGWGIALAIHAMVVFIETGMLERMQESEMEREIEREKQIRYLKQKPKRDANLHLSDDGELIPADELTDVNTKTQNSSRR